MRSSSFLYCSRHFLVATRVHNTCVSETNSLLWRSQLRSFMICDPHDYIYMCKSIIIIINLLLFGRSRKIASRKINGVLATISNYHFLQDAKMICATALACLVKYWSFRTVLFSTWSVPCSLYNLFSALYRSITVETCTLSKPRSTNMEFEFLSY